MSGRPMHIQASTALESRRHRRGIRRRRAGGERNEARQGAEKQKTTIILFPNQGARGGGILSRMPHHARSRRGNAENRPTQLRADRGFEIQRRDDEHHAGSSGSKPLSMDHAPQTEAETEEMRVTLYREAVGALKWVETMTRPVAVVMAAVVMAAVLTSGPIGCLLIVSTPPLQPKNVQSRKKASPNRGARGETPTMSFVPGANREGKERVRGKASPIQGSRIGSVLVCVRRNAQLRELKLLESTRCVLNTVVMIAASTDGPTGCLVCPPSLSPQNIQPHEQSPAGRGACCGTAHRLLLATAVSLATIPGAGIGWRKSS